MPSNHVHSEMDYIGCEEQPDITGFKIHESRFGQSWELVWNKEDTVRLSDITVLNFYSCSGYFRADFEFKVLLGLFHSS